MRSGGNGGDAFPLGDAGKTLTFGLGCCAKDATLSIVAHAKPASASKAKLRPLLIHTEIFHGWDSGNMRSSGSWWPLVKDKESARVWPHDTPLSSKLRGNRTDEDRESPWNATPKGLFCNA